MLFSLAQLNKYNLPYEFIDDLDLKKELVGFEDIIDIKNISIKGKLLDNKYDTFIFEFNLECILVIESSISLEQIEYPLNLTFKESYSLKDSDDSFEINGQTLDTKEAIITNILINKPSNYHSDNEYFESYQEEEKENINEAFKSLKDLL